MSILLVANQGSLFRKVYSSLLFFYSVEVFVVGSFDDASALACAFFDLVRLKKFDCIVYISGETRDTSRMHCLNIFLPSLIARQCHSLDIPFLGLSSLSVFGNPRTYHIHEFSARIPSCSYGVTKNNFDLFLMNSLNGLYASILIPGSIINPSSSHNIFSKCRKWFHTWPFIPIFLQAVSPSGFFPCIHIDDLVCAIVEETRVLLSRQKNTDKGAVKFVICSFNVPLSIIFSSISFRKSRFLLPAISPSLISRILFFLPPLIRMKLILIFSSVIYGSPISTMQKYGRLECLLGDSSYN